ncbi:MAG: serine/threonine-protein kinase, partial [Gemmatimonadales bacterium]
MPDQRDEIFEQLRDAVQDRYTVQRELGRGGMARVYLAEEHNPRRQVAIKVMNPEIASARMRARFLREIDLASKLTHPHIVPVFAAGEEDDLLYYMMPYITGESLRVILDRQGQLSNDEALRIAFAIAEALSYAHTRGVVHRDIKPENVLLSDGHAVVLDFGVARAFADSDAPALTQAGTPVGTPAYMSPEQWAGETVDGRTDIFSLGCVLYEMAFGRVAEGAPADRAAVVARTMRRSGSDAAALTIAMVVARCLEPNRDDRFASAEALVESLLAGVHPSGPVSQPSVVKGLAVLAIIVLVAIGVRVASTRVAGRGDEGVRVAVAVLENQTGDSDLDPLGVMASDWITQGLMRTGLVEVVGTRTSLALSGAAIAEEANPITGLAVATDADIVISGRYY